MFAKVSLLVYMALRVKRRVVAPADRSKAVPLLQLFLVCMMHNASVSLSLCLASVSVPREGCASCLSPFHDNVIYIFVRCFLHD